MLQLKQFTVFAICLILTLVVLPGISGPERSDSSVKINSSTTFAEDSSQLIASDRFEHYFDQIQNKSIDKKEIQSEVNKLQSEFEREFLYALIEKRSGNYDEYFKRLFALTNTLPKYLAYYEELTFSAKVSGNLKKIAAWLESNKENSDNPYYTFLDALYFSQSGKYSEGIERLEKLINQNIKSKEVYLQLANGYRIIGDYEKSYHSLIEAEKMCEVNDRYLAKISNLKGTIFFLSGDYQKAKSEYDLALKSSRDFGSKVEEIKSIANLAIIKDQFGEIYEAREDFQRAIEMAKEIENTELLSFLYSELGVSFTYTNNLIESRKNYERSFALYEQLKNNERLSYLSSNIGSLYLQISNYYSAHEFYKKGLMFAGENKLGRILSLTGLGDVYSNESNYAKALEYYSLAKAIADSINDVSSISKIDQGIGALYFNANRPYEALEVLRKTESSLTPKDSPFETIKLYSKIGTILTSLDSLTESEKYFSKALQLADEVGDIYSSLLIKTELAHNYTLQQKYQGALKLLFEVQNLSKSYELTQLLGVQELYKGMIYSAQGDLVNSTKNFENAFKMSESVNDFSNQVEAAYLLGKNYDEKGNSSEAEKWYKNAIQVIEQITLPLTLNQEIQISHFSGVNSIYNSLAEIYLKQGRGEEAFLVIDKSRSRNTKSNLDRLQLLSHLQDENDYEQFIDLQWMTNSGLYDKSVTDSLMQILSDLKKELSAKSRQLDLLINQNHSVNLSKIQKELDDTQNIISIYAGNNFTTIFNVSSNNFRFTNLNFSADSLLSMLEQVSSIYRSNPENQEIYINEDLFAFDAYASFKLYKNLLHDFLSSIPKGSALIFNLPSELLNFPFEMLVTEWKDGESPYFYSDKKFLLNDFNISYTPSSIIFAMQKYDSQNESDQNLLLGDPYIKDSEYALSVRSGLVNLSSSHQRSISLFPLKYSKDEIESINNTIDGNLILLSDEATETNFKKNANQSNIIHISSHSFLIKDQPFILFTKQEDNLDDGFLELGEIVQLNLNSELVVLSSCRSGLGKIDEAEGVIGMQKAFFDAGSKSVLVSLWDVNDKYTSYFMKDFYSQLVNGKSKPEALRIAKLNFIKEHSANPYYWSAFVLSGNTSSIEVKHAASVGLKAILLFILLVSGIYFTILWIRKKRFAKI